MSVQYRLDVKSTAGVLQAQVADYVGTLTYSKAVNEVGLLQFSVPANHSAVQYLGANAQVEVWRRDTKNAVPWAREFAGLMRTKQYAYPLTGPEVYQVWCPSQLTMLGWRIVAWKAGTVNRSKFTTQPAETIMSNLVAYNATAAATVAAGRLAEGAITGVTVEADGAGGNSLDYACAYKNLLSALQEVARIGGGDFDLVPTGTNTWEYRFYPGQLGTDRSATVAFSLALGNMGAPTLTDSRANEITMAIVGGQGEESLRTTAVRTNSDYHVTNAHYETFRDARDRTTAAGLNAAGDETLDRYRNRPVLLFEVVPTPSCVYGRDYFVGDKVSAVYRGYSATMKVAGLHVTFSQDGGETLQFDLEEV
jgi:hypothetical protein